MSRATPPPGYVDMIEAESITGVTHQTIALAVKSGELAGYQRVRYSPWYFTVADLRRWRGLPEHEPDPSLVTTGRG